MFLAPQAGLVGGRGQVPGVIAEGEFQRAEQLGVGGIDQGLGRLPRGSLQSGSELLGQGADPGFTVIRGRRRGRKGLRQHGRGPAVG